MSVHFQSTGLNIPAETPEPRLPASVQPQVWVNDNAEDDGASIPFDAHDILVGMTPAQFSQTVAKILEGGHDYDELAIKSGLVSEWLEEGKNNTFLVSVSPYAMEDWLAANEMTKEEALTVDEAALARLRGPSTSPAAPKP